VSNAIPYSRRLQVKAREGDRCFRCHARGAQWHHRRTRSVRDAHQHCSCNGVWLCVTCHGWVHAHPFEARAEGLIVSRHQPLPGSETAVTWFGPVLLDCVGGFSAPSEQQEEG
jgi:hypothetical protein